MTGLGHDFGRAQRRALRYVGKIGAYAVALVIADTLALLILGWLARTTLALLLFLQGGLGLLVGVGISLSSTPYVSRLGQVLFDTSPWSRDGEKHAEVVGFRWMLGSVFLIVIGFGVSVL